MIMTSWVVLSSSILVVGLSVLVATNFTVDDLPFLFSVVAPSTTQFYFGTSMEHDASIRLGRYELNVSDYFSTSYRQARSKFRTAAMDRGYSLFSLPIQSDTNNDLTIDIAIIPGTIRSTIVHSSGTHGVEGYAGSAIQMALLDGVLDSEAFRGAERRPTVVLIHAVNPYGMHNFRRTNEHNVDLNRNCIDDFETFTKNRDPNIAGYETLRHLYAPNRTATFWDTTAGYWVSAIQALAKHGFPTAKRAMVAGQYHHPKGIMYGGSDKLEASIQSLYDYLKGDILQNTAVWIDVHTGLGKHGMDTLSPALTTPSHVASNLSKYFDSAFHILESTSGMKDSALSGYELTKGMLVDFFMEQSKAHGLYMVQEFGTIPTILVGRSLILENTIHFWNSENAKDYAKWLMVSAFYPQTRRWRREIVQRGVQAFLSGIKYIEDHPLEMKQRVDEETHDEDDEAVLAAQIERRRKEKEERSS